MNDLERRLKQIEQASVAPHDVVMWIGGLAVASVSTAVVGMFCGVITG